MIRPPKGSNPFEFIVVSGQRAAQLMRGCTPRVDNHLKTVSKAQLEVATGLIKPVESSVSSLQSPVPSGE